MINNNLYDITTPIYDFDTDNSYSGYIPDQNQPQYYQPDNLRDLYMQQQMQQDMEQQFQQYMQQKQAEQQAQQYYNIQRGDTLGQIAAAHGMSVQDLARLNGINNINLIRAGQRLRFNDDLDNVYRDVVSTRRTRAVRRSTASNNVISSNPKRVQQQVNNVNTQTRTTARKQYSNTTNTSPEVVVTAKRPVKPVKKVNKQKNIIYIPYEGGEIQQLGEYYMRKSKQDRMKKQVLNSQDGHTVGYIPESQDSYNRLRRYYESSNKRGQKSKPEPAFGLDWLF